MKQLNAQERRALARYAARIRWHPREAQAARECAQEITYLIKQALKDGNYPSSDTGLYPAQTPLVIPFSTGWLVSKKVSEKSETHKEEK